MTIDPNTFRERAASCLKIASETDPVLRESLSDAARRWERLASIAADTNDILARWRVQQEKQIRADLPWIPHL